MLTTSSSNTGKTEIVLFRGTQSTIDINFFVDVGKIVDKDDTPGIDELKSILDTAYPNSNVDVHIYNSVALNTTIDIDDLDIPRNAEEIGSDAAIAELQRIGFDNIDKLIVVGKSGGGLSAVKLAEKLGDFPVDLLVQMDSVDSVSFYNSLNSGALIEEKADTLLADWLFGDVGDGSDQADIDGFNYRRENEFPPEDTQLPQNVVRGLNIYQISDYTNPYEQTVNVDFSGTKNVSGSTNVNAEELFNDPGITHLSIDNNVPVRNLVLNEIAKELATPLLADGGPRRFEGGTLVLNAGPEAPDRKFGDVVDDREFFTLAADGSGVPSSIVVKAFGTSQTYENVDWIEARAGFGEDVIDASRVDVPVALEGGPGDDVLRGGNRDDWLAGGADRDLLDGGPGFDTADYYDSPERVVLLLANTDQWGVGGEAGTINQAVRLSGGDAEGDTLVNIEKLATSKFDDLVFGFHTGTWADLWNGDDTFDNNEERDAEDHIFGGHGNDRIWTGAGNDELYGEWDDDWLIGEVGADTIVGGDGRDGVIYTGSPEGVTVILSPTDAWGVGGFDETKGLSPGGYYGTPSGSSGGHAAGDTFPEEDIENVVGSWFDDYIFGSNSGTVAELKQGNDWFDNAEAVAVSDRVDGGEGDDHIWTGAGNDILNGGPENDDLWGEGGRDIFVFRDDFDFDTVHDFTLGLDQLWIVGFDRSHVTLLPGTGSDTVIRVVSTETYKDNEQITLKNFVAPQGFLEQITLADEPPDQPLI